MFAMDKCKVSLVCKELFGNTFESLTFLKSQGTSTDSLLARIVLIVDNNEETSFNSVISTYLINNPVILFPSGVFKSPNILYSGASIYIFKKECFILNINDWTVYDLTDHFDPNLHWVVAYFIGLCNY